MIELLKKVLSVLRGIYWLLAMLAAGTAFRTMGVARKNTIFLMELHLFSFTNVYKKCTNRTA
jgi:hypothetical protein